MKILVFLFAFGLASSSWGIAIVVNVVNLRASTTEKGDVASIFEKSDGLWQGKTAANPKSAQKLSDEISVVFEHEVQIQTIHIQPCDHYPFSSSIWVRVFGPSTHDLVPLKSAECKTHECFGVPRESSKQIKSISLDFGFNPHVCVKSVWFDSGTKAGIVVKVDKAANKSSRN